MQTYQGFGRIFIRIALMKKLMGYIVQTIQDNKKLLKVTLPLASYALRVVTQRLSPEEQSRGSGYSAYQSSFSIYKKLEYFSEIIVPNSKSPKIAFSARVTDAQLSSMRTDVFKKMTHWNGCLLIRQKQSLAPAHPFFNRH